jgi:RNA polymerase I-specific transcription initiation factor RRN6
MRQTAPSFRIVQPFAEWYPASKTAAQDSVTLANASRRRQKRWLRATHPQASFAETVFDDILSEETRLSISAQTPSRPLPLLAVGSMEVDLFNTEEDKSKQHRKFRDMPLLAMASGSSGDVLRLARMNDSAWEWRDDLSINIFSVNVSDTEDETLWADGPQPISQIKFAYNSVVTPHDRWVIVQKGVSTTILEPISHAVPLPNRSKYWDGISQNVSRIDPRRLGALSLRQTGGNPHSDVSFNPPTQDGACFPQLALIDEGGYWSVWDVNTQRRNVLTASELRACGNIHTGPLFALPTEPSLRKESHGILWVGMPGHTRDANASAHPVNSRLFAGTDHPSTRATIFLMWNRSILKASDLQGNNWTPSFQILKMSDMILDVRLLPAHEDQVMVLTTSTLLWIQIVSSTEESGGSEVEFLKLLAVPHHRDQQDHTLRLVCRKEEVLSKDSSLVGICSSQTSRIDLYWLRLLEMMGDVHYHRQVYWLPEPEEGQFDSLDSPLTLCFVPTNLVDHSNTQGTGSVPQLDHLARDFQFHQMLLLGKRLGLASSVTATALESDFQRVGLDRMLSGWVLPTRKPRRSNDGRPKLTKSLQNAFVVPDRPSESRSLGARSSETDSVAITSCQIRRSTVVSYNMSNFWAAVRFYRTRSTAGGADGPSAMVDAIREASIEALQNGYMTLKPL